MLDLAHINMSNV